MGKQGKAPVVVVGAGYVGLVTAVGLSKVREVRLVDLKAGLIEELKAGRTSIYEPDLEARFAAGRPHMRFHTDLEEALDDGRPQLVFVAVGTPSRQRSNGSRDGEEGDAANLDSVDDVTRKLYGHPGIAVVMKSTVPPGTGRRIIERAREQGSDLVYLSCPEFLREGEAFKSFEQPDRIVVGRDEPTLASAALRELHMDLEDEREEENRTAPPYLEMTVIEAELIKHASNFQLASRISYVNQIANVCEEVGADVLKVMKGVGADQRIGPHFLKAGIGFGGSCFDKDIRALAAEAKSGAGLDLTLARTVLEVNAGQVERAVAKLERRLPSLRDAHVAILGLAFKAETDDLRNGPAFALAAVLREKGAAISAWDPQDGARRTALRNVNKDEPEWLTEEELADSALDAMDGTDAAVVVTEWPEFAEIDWCEAARVMRGTLVLDGRNCLSPKTIREAGLEYEGTGRESRGLTRSLPEAAAKT